MLNVERCKNVWCAVMCHPWSNTDHSSIWTRTRTIIIIYCSYKFLITSSDSVETKKLQICLYNLQRFRMSTISRKIQFLVRMDDSRRKIMTHWHCTQVVLACIVLLHHLLRLLLDCFVFGSFYFSCLKCTIVSLTYCLVSRRHYDVLRREHIIG